MGSLFVELGVVDPVNDELEHVLPPSIGLVRHLQQQPNRHLSPILHTDCPHRQLLDVLLLLDLLNDSVGLPLEGAVPLGVVGYLDLSVNFSLLPVFDEDGRTLQPLPITHVEGGEHAQLRVPIMSTCRSWCSLVW